MRSWPKVVVIPRPVSLGTEVRPGFRGTQCIARRVAGCAVGQPFGNVSPRFQASLLAESGRYIPGWKKRSFHPLQSADI
jgi:hypothetical protein